jgi:hypothetical protein
MNKSFAFALAATFAASAAAQAPARPDPAEPKAAKAAPRYESAFTGYRPYVDPEVARWREVNDEVGRLNGHLGHVPEQASGVAKPAAKPPAQGGHGAHK